MVDIIKSGYYIDDVEVTSEHIGMKAEVVETDNRTYLPIGFIATIHSVECDYVEFEDAGGDSSYYDVHNSEHRFKFKWVNSPVIKPKQSSTKPARQKLAKSIKQSVADIQKLIDEAESYGMIVEGLQIEEIEVKFQPPMEVY